MQKEIILTGLCFWSTQAIFQRIKGVEFTECGYYDIHTFDFAWSEYDKLESVLVRYDSSVITLDTLLDIYFLTHNPSLVAWTQEECIYPLCRPAIFCFNEEDLNFVSTKTETLKTSWTEPFYTKVLSADSESFKKASEYDQDFYNKRPKEYFSCSNIQPKLEKVRNSFPDLFLTNNS